MAKPSWLTISPIQGSGNQTINNSAAPHTGRLVREGVVTITAAGVATPITYRVLQEALPEYVQWNNGTEMAVAVQGGKAVIYGTSNSDRLTFNWVIPEGGTEPEIDANGNTSTGGINYPSVNIPDKYIAGGVSTYNDQALEGDPGATMAYSFNIELNFPANDAVVEVFRTLQVKSGGHQIAQIVIKQAASAARIEVSVSEITIPQDGSAVSVNVISNTDWTVS